MSYQLPPGAVPPANGWRPTWGPPYATPRDCPAPDWNYLCPWGRHGRCVTSCWGLSEDRMLEDAVAAALRNPAPPVVLDHEAALHVAQLRRKRGKAAALRALAKHGLDEVAASAWLAAHTRGVYGGNGNPPKE